MFGMLDVAGTTPLNLPFQGPQVRGFGYLHDGSVDTLFRFFNANVFRNDSVGGPNVGFQNNQQRRDVEQFMLAFDSNLAPVVGQQITLDASNAGVVGPRIDLLRARDAVNECDLIVKGTVNGEARGWMWSGSGAFLPDRLDEPVVSDAALRALATVPGQALTYTCMPPGSGVRTGIDRDEDGFLDRDELDAGTDPADPASFPGAAASLVPTRVLKLRDGATASKRAITFRSNTKQSTGSHIVPPAEGSAGDPTVGGATLTVYNATGVTADVVQIDLPAAGWSPVGGKTLKGWRFKSTDHALGIRRVVVKGDQILVRGGKDGWTYSLDEPEQESIAVRLRLGTSDGWCAAAPAQMKGNPPSTAKSDRPGLFAGQPKSPAPAVCPPLPGGGSPSGAFVETAPRS